MARLDTQVTAVPEWHSSQSLIGRYVRKKPLMCQAIEDGGFICHGSQYYSTCMIQWPTKWMNAWANAGHLLHVHGKPITKEDLTSPSGDPVSAAVPLEWTSTKRPQWCSCTPRRWWLRAAPRCWARLPGSTHRPGRSWWRAPCRGLSGQLGTRQRVRGLASITRKAFPYNFQVCLTTCVCVFSRHSKFFFKIHTYC